MSPKFLKNLTQHQTMYDIQLNESGTRHLDITDENLQTIRKYNLFQMCT